MGLAQIYIVMRIVSPDSGQYTAIVIATDQWQLKGVGAKSNTPESRFGELF